MSQKLEKLRPDFEAYILTERPRSYLERQNPAITLKAEYANSWVQEAWEAWIAAAERYQPKRIGPTQPDNDMVICPTCTSQFQAIPVNVQSRLQALESPPAIPVPSHVHCVSCGETHCPGVQTREALPLYGPAPLAIRQARAEGRAEALEILVATSAESFSDKYIGSHAIADTGDYEAHWNEDELRTLLEITKAGSSVIDRLESAYWTQQAYINGLQIQISGEWLPIEAAESEQDGRYILGWFPDRPRGMKVCESDPPEPWVAAVRWSGKYGLWGFIGVGGLMPARFRRITGPDGKPVGFISGYLES